MAQTLTPKEIAQEWGTDARTLRKFLRSPNGTGKVGQGNRHAIDRKALNRLHKAFIAWNEAKAPKDPAPDEAPEVLEVLDDDNGVDAE